MEASNFLLHQMFISHSRSTHGMHIKSARSLSVKGSLLSQLVASSSSRLHRRRFISSACEYVSSFMIAAHLVVVSGSPLFHTESSTSEPTSEALDKTSSPSWPTFKSISGRVCFGMLVLGVRRDGVVTGGLTVGARDFAVLDEGVERPVCMLTDPGRDKAWQTFAAGIVVRSFHKIDMTDNLQNNFSAKSANGVSTFSFHFFSV
jgi:hypothetical protein